MKSKRNRLVWMVTALFLLIGLALGAVGLQADAGWLGGDVPVQWVGPSGGSGSSAG